MEQSRRHAAEGLATVARPDSREKMAFNWVDLLHSSICIQVSLVVPLNSCKQC